MESSRKRMKSLKDTLLEYAVLNMELLFTELEAIPIFPRYLFDEILERSKDMCWKIKTAHLITERDKLKWSDRCFFRHVDKFWPSEAKDFASSVHDLKILKLIIILTSMTDENIFREISHAADTLEDLELEMCIHTRARNYFMINPGSAFSENIKAKIGTRALLKLKRLRLNVESFELFPYTLDSDKLTVFDLYDCKLTKTFLQTLVGFKRLVHLSLYDSQIKEVSMRQVIDAVITFKDMRFLNLCIEETCVDEIMLNKIMKNMENLDILELDRIFLKHPGRLVTPKTKLKVLNYRNLFSKNINEMSEFTCLASRIGNRKNFKGLMTIMSTTPTRQLYVEAVERLLRLINKESLDYEELIEAEKKNIFNFRSPLRLNETFQSKKCSSSFYDLRLTMICYYVHYYGDVDMPITAKWIKDFVVRNENTHLAKRLGEYVLISS